LVEKQQSTGTTTAESETMTSYDNAGELCHNSINENIPENNDNIPQNDDDLSPIDMSKNCNFSFKETGLYYFS